MSQLIEIKTVDRRFYRDRLEAFLPERILDMHTHVWLKRFRRAAPTGRAVTWPLRVAEENPIEDLLTTYAQLLPGKAVRPLVFSLLESADDDFAGANAYVGMVAAQHDLPALVFAAPSWSAERFEREIAQGGFLGAKVYLTLASPTIATEDITIYDFLPHHQLEVLDQHGWLVMLHIPRSDRLRDPVNLAQMLEIERTYPNVKLIIAHVGRAYCIENVGNAFERLAQSERMVFDFSANTNRSVFEQLIRAVGPQRIVFGSDLPIARMRMRRISEQANYVNLVPRGLYGDVSDDPHMREVSSPEADTLSFFLYEQIEAFRLAAEDLGLTHRDIEDVFYNNAAKLIHSAANNKQGV
jgi:predicted TIM-barrel fold metal-dependent hydrolase